MPCLYRRSPSGLQGPSLAQCQYPAPTEWANILVVCRRSSEVVVEIQLREPLLKVFHLHLRGERFSAPAAACLGTSAGRLFVKGDTKLSRPLEDVKELTEGQIQ